MKLLKTSSVLFFSALTFFSISNVNAGSCRSYIEKKVEIECSSDDKKCIDAKEKELLYEVEV